MMSALNASVKNGLDLDGLKQHLFLISQVTGLKSSEWGVWLDSKSQQDKEDNSASLHLRRHQGRIHFSSLEVWQNLLFVAWGQSL